MKYRILTLLTVVIVMLACTNDNKDFFSTDEYDNLNEGEIIRGKFLKFSEKEMFELMANSKVDTIPSGKFDRIANQSGSVLFNYNPKEKFHYIGQPSWKICPDGCKLKWIKGPAYNNFVCDCSNQTKVDCKPRIFKRNGLISRACDAVECHLQCNPKGGFYFDKKTSRIIFPCDCNSIISDPGNPSGDPGSDLFPDGSDTIPTPAPAL